jgi:hypothetical protein
MAMTIEAVPIIKTLNSGRSAAKANEKTPPKIASIPNMIASIAIIVTERGRFLNDSLSVLYQDVVSIQKYNLIW